MKDIATKTTVGFVTQQFDIHTEQCVGVDFTAGDCVEWEDENGDSMEDLNYYDPYLMLSSTELRSMSERIQENIRVRLDGLNNRAVDAACQGVVDEFRNYL